MFGVSTLEVGKCQESIVRSCRCQFADVESLRDTEVLRLAVRETIRGIMNSSQTTRMPRLNLGNTMARWQF